MTSDGDPAVARAMAQPDRVRIGVVIDLPDAVSDPIGLVRRQHHLVGPGEMIGEHITLLPPTEVTSAELLAFEGHLIKVASATAPFGVDLQDVETFRPISPVVFLRVADGAADCDRLQRALRDGPVPVELRYDYHPHVTVAHDLGQDRLDEAMRLFAGYRARVQVTSFVLYEAHLTDGPRPAQDVAGQDHWRPRRRLLLSGPAPQGVGAA